MDIFFDINMIENLNKKMSKILVIAFFEYISYIISNNFSKPIIFQEIAIIFEIINQIGFFMTS